MEPGTSSATEALDALTIEDKGDANNTAPPCVLVLGMAGSGKSSFVQVCKIEIDLNS